MSERIELPQWPLGRVRAVAAGLGIQVWPVGGVVRDVLLGRDVHDWDFVVERDALALARAVADDLGGAFVVLDEGRDTGRVVLRRDAEVLEIDFVALRGRDLLSDLWARDFTLNAMAVGPDGEVIDPTGGQRDLGKQLVRVTTEVALDEDPLRMLRGVRLAAELDMRLEAKTAAWMKLRADSLARPAAERVRDEFARILAAPTVADHIHLLDDLGLLAQVVPEVGPLRDQAQTWPHRFDVWWHTLLAVEAVVEVPRAVAGGSVSPAYVDAPERVWGDLQAMLGRFAPALQAHLGVPLRGGRKRRTMLVLAALCHDFGKPLTCTEGEQGRLHFYGHEHVGAELTEARLRQLRFSEVEVEWGRKLVWAHLRPAHLAQVSGVVTRRAVFRYFRALGDAGIDVVLLSLADHLAAWGTNLQPERWARRLEVAETLLSHYLERQEEAVAPVPLITGRDLIDVLGLEEGPQVGRILEAVREHQAAGEVGTREEALALARSMT